MRNYPTLARQIHTLPWVQDGLSDLERSAVDELLYIAVEDVANLDAALGLPWVQDDIRQVEYELLDFLGVLDNLNPANLLAALDMAWVQDGAGSAYITNNTRWLARNYPALFLQIHTLSWVQDGLSDLERSAVDELLYIAVEDVANLDAALGLPWVQDDIRQVEYEFLDFLGVLDNLNPANLLAALDMAWVQDGAGSAYITNNTRWLARNYPALFLQIHTLSWVQDGLSDLERSAVDELLWIAVEDVTNLEAALRVSWVQDDIQEAEYQALDKLGYLDTPSPANLYAALNLSWVQDDISETEYDIIDSLGALDFDATDVVFRLLSMPFLLSPDATDALAIQGMENLADRDRLSALTDHSIFQDGVTDDETTLIAAVGTLRDARTRFSGY